VPWSPVYETNATPIRIRSGSPWVVLFDLVLILCVLAHAQDNQADKDAQAGSCHIGSVDRGLVVDFQVSNHSITPIWVGQKAIIIIIMYIS
jgi:hypothetical protein